MPDVLVTFSGMPTFAAFLEEGLRPEPFDPNIEWNLDQVEGFDPIVWSNNPEVWPYVQVSINEDASRHLVTITISDVLNGLIWHASANTIVEPGQPVTFSPLLDSVENPVVGSAANSVGP